jgi:hypothetical protein
MNKDVLSAGGGIRQQSGEFAVEDCLFTPCGHHCASVVVTSGHFNPRPAQARSWSCTFDRAIIWVRKRRAVKYILLIFRGTLPAFLDIYSLPCAFIRPSRWALHIFDLGGPNQCAGRLWRRPKRVAIGDDQVVQFRDRFGGGSGGEDRGDAEQMRQHHVFERLIQCGRYSLRVMPVPRLQIPEERSKDERHKTRFSSEPVFAQMEGVLKVVRNHRSFSEKRLQPVCWHRLLPQIRVW